MTAKNLEIIVRGHDWLSQELTPAEHEEEGNNCPNHRDGHSIEDTELIFLN